MNDGELREIAQGPPSLLLCSEISGPVDLEAIAAGAIPIQGRLTNQLGAPLNGTFSMTFRLYEVPSGGTALCSDNNTITVTNGLFSSYLDGCYTYVTGQPSLSRSQSRERRRTIGRGTYW